MRNERHKVVDGFQIIEIRVKDPHQLFDYRDPAPFRQRDLDEDFTKYLEAYIDELSLKQPLKLQIYIENPDPEVPAEVLQDSIHGYFQYQIQIKYGQLAKTYRTAQIFLLIGIVLIGICLGIAQVLGAFESSPVASTLREGVVIFGWVSLWRPIELILFDWYPIVDRIRLYKRLTQTEIQLSYDPIAP